MFKNKKYKYLVYLLLFLFISSFIVKNSTKENLYTINRPRPRPTPLIPRPIVSARTLPPYRPPLVQYISSGPGYGSPSPGYRRYGSSGYVRFGM